MTAEPAATVTFDTATLASLDATNLDALAFGVVRMDADLRVNAYNRAEAECAGLTPSRVLGRRFFSEVAPCMNTALVARRLESGDALDETLEYVLTLRMAPTPVRLRLLQGPGSPHRYLLVQRP